MDLRAYHGDEGIKQKYLARVIAHYEADEIVRGQYWENGKGCAVGCTIHSDNHNAYESELGIPEWLARLEDRVFEGLPNGRAKEFPKEFLESIRVGANLAPVKWKFCAFILKENIERVLTLTISDDLKKQVIDAIRGCLVLHEKAAESGGWDESAAWSAAESAARSAAWSAAYERYADELLRLLREAE